MTDIVERLRSASSRPERDDFGIGDFWNLCDESGDYIESLRQQLAESQARENVLRGALETWYGDPYDDISGQYKINKTKKALAMPSDSTALDSAIRQAKREALLDMAGMITTLNACDQAAELRRMADDLK